LKYKDINHFVKINNDKQTETYTTQKIKINLNVMFSYNLFVLCSLFDQTE